MLKAIITSRYYLRDKPVQSYHSFGLPNNIEETLVRQLDFLNQYESFDLKLELSKNSS